MKKILVLLMLIALRGAAQDPATVTLVHVSQDTLAPGDTIDIYFTYVAPSPTHNVSNNFFYLQTLPPNPQTQVVFQDNYNTFKYLPVKTINSIECKVLAIATPTAWKLGDSKIHTSLFTSSTNMLALHFRIAPVDTTGGNDTTGNDSTGVGIIEWQLSHPEPRYYDIHGARVEKQYNTLLIEQVGIRRRKVVIVE